MTTNILKDINSSYIYEIATNLKPLINKDITSDIINSIKNKTYPEYFQAFAAITDPVGKTGK